jgi:hypothetical protein
VKKVLKLSGKGTKEKKAREGEDKERKNIDVFAGDSSVICLGA